MVLLKLKKLNDNLVPLQGIQNLVDTILDFKFKYDSLEYLPNASLKTIDLTYYGGMSGIIDSLIEYYNFLNSNGNN